MENEKIENMQIYCALIAFQGEVPVICKAAQGYGYKYATLAEIMKTIQPFMVKNGLGIFQRLNTDGNDVAVLTRIIHTSGEYLESIISADATKNQGKMSLIQAVGASSTYLRRYGLSAMLGLVTDTDTDGHVDSKAQKTLEEKQLVAVEEIESVKDEIQKILNKITDSDIVLKAEVYMDKNKSLNSMNKLLENVTSALDTQNTTYQQGQE